MKTAIAFYDFDNTLIRHDSQALLLFYYLKKHPGGFVHLFKLLYVAVLYVLGLKDFIALKEALLFPLGRLTDEELKDFTSSLRFYPEVVKTIAEHRKQGCLIFLVSASTEYYLDMLEIAFDAVIGTRVIVNNHHVNILGPNCKSEEKVERINEILKQKNLIIDFEHSYAYSDSDSDLPMMLLVQNRRRVLRNGKITGF